MKFAGAVVVEHTSCTRTHLSADTVSKNQNLITNTKKMEYNGNSADEYLDHASKQITELTSNMSEKIELASEVNSKEKELITRKRTAKMFLDDVVRQVEQGNLYAPFAVLQIKQLQKLFAQTLSDLEEKASDDLIGTDHYIWGDYKITRREGAVRYDFSECEEVVTMEKHFKELKGKYIAAHKGVESGATVTLEGHKFVDGNGEVLQLPKKKYNKTSIVLTKA